MKNTKKINLLLFILSLIAFFVLFGSTTKVNASITTITMQVDTDVINVRSKPNTKYSTSIIGNLKKYDTVEVDIINKKTGWVRITDSNCVRGYESGKYQILPQQYGYCQLKHLKVVQVQPYTTNAEVKVYNKTSTKSDSTLLKTIAPFSTIKVLETTTSWAKLSTGGFCLIKDLQKIKGEHVNLYGTPLLTLHTYPYVSTKNIADHYDGKKAVFLTDMVLIKNANGTQRKWVRLNNGYYGVKQNLLDDIEFQIAKEIDADNNRIQY